MPAALAVPAAISAGSAVVGGIIQSKKAKKAADAQVKAAEEARGIGKAAGEQAAGDVVKAGEAGAANVEGAANTAATGVEEAARQAGEGMDVATRDANQVLTGIYDESKGALEPYLEGGAEGIKMLREMVSGPGSEFSFSEDDPSYQWRLGEGQKALERSVAARGMLNSGSTLKALTNYAQGAASQEYQNAFNRWLASRGQKAGMVSTLAGFGSDATGRLIGAGETYGGRVAGNLINAAGYKGDTKMRGAETGGRFRVGGAEYGSNLRYGAAGDAGRFRMAGAGMETDAILGAGNARSAGHVASGNAWNNALTGVGNAAAAWGANRTLADFTRLPAVSQPVYTNPWGNQHEYVIN